MWVTGRPKRNSETIWEASEAVEGRGCPGQGARRGPERRMSTGSAWEAEPARLTGGWLGERGIRDDIRVLASAAKWMVTTLLKQIAYSLSISSAPRELFFSRTGHSAQQ